MKRRIIGFLILAYLCVGNILTVSAAEADNIEQMTEGESVTEPVIKDISVITENVKAPGQAELKIELSEEGETELLAVRMVLRGEVYTDKVIYCWFTQEQFARTDEAYSCVINLGENIVADTYMLTELELYDTEEQTRNYVWNSETGKLTDWAGGYEAEPVKLIVTDGCKDTDFAVPVLQELSFDATAYAGKTMEATVKATDTSGIKKASLVFYNYDLEQYLYLNSVETTDLKNGKYKFSFKLHNYQYDDSYELESVTLTDNSAHANAVTYWVAGDYLENTDGRKIDFPSTKQYLEIVQNKTVKWTTTYTTDFYSTVSNAKEDEVIAVIGGDSDGSLWILDKRPLNAARVKNHTLILPDLLTDTEIIIPAAKIPTELPNETYAGLLITGFIEGYFDLKLQMTTENIPFQMRFKTKELSLLDNRTFSLVKVEADGTETVLQDNLITDNEGYLNLDFAEGISSQEDWCHYRLRRNEELPCENGHDLMETLQIVKASLTQDGYERKFCKTCGTIEKSVISHIEKISLSYTKYIYNGNIRKPVVTVIDANGEKLVKDRDYTVSYSTGRKAVGRYTVKVTFKGRYEGNSTKYFTIVPKAVTYLKAIRYQYGNQVRLTWKQSAGATGYRVYVKKTSASQYTYLGATKNLYYVKGNLTKNTAYRFKIIPYYKTDADTTHYYSTDSYRTYLINIVPKGNKLVQVSGVKVAKSGTKVKVSWKNVNYETGYQISRAASKTGTNIVATYKTTSGKSKVIAAAKNKTFYYKVRAYRVVNGKKIFGMWSSPVKFTRK